MDILDETMEKELLYSSDVDYHALNAQLNLLGEDGKLQLDADKESVRQFFLQHVNQNTVFFHDLEEKIRYLIDNEYYEPQLFERYEWDFVKSLFKRAYAYKYRFTTFLGAFKYYSSYTLKTFDGKRYLERFEDRVTVTALYLADGDTALAEHILDEVMSGRLQPATPTFLNAGKRQRGELVSCFPAGTPVDTSEGQVNIENLNVGDMVLSHDGKYHAVTEVLINDNSESLVSVRHYGHKDPILCTPNHPILVWTNREVESLTEGDGADPENGFVWLEAQDIQKGDYVVIASPALAHSDNKLETNIGHEENSEFRETVNGRYGFMVANVALTNNAPERVYNLEVDETHTYSVRGTVVHNCFLLRTEDDMESIARSITSSLQLSKRGGGVALNLTNLRGEGDPIKKIEGQSSGVVPVMKMLEDAFSYANQLGSRQGAGAVYLNVHHPDILKFLDTKRENADEKIRIKTLSLGVVIPDITFHLAKNNEDMYLFSPYDVERVYGKPFSDVSVSELYYDMVDNPDIRKKKINARQLFMTLAEIQFESGYPYILFEDTANRANPIEGRINMSNLCVTGDTRVLTDMGYKKIGDVYESNADFRVVADNRAKKMSGNAKGVSVVDSSRVFRTAQNAEVFEVTTLTGYKIRATEWHKFYVIRPNNKVEKIRLNELREGDTLLVQGDAGVYGNIHKPAEAYIAGALSVRGAFTDGEAWMSSRFEDMDEFIHLFQNSVDVVTGDESTLHDVLERLGIHEETYAQVPEFVFAGDKETQESFVSGVLDAVGDVHESEITVVGDKDLLIDVQKVLLNLGVFARVFYDRLVVTGVDAVSWTSMSRVHDTITGENLKKLPRVARVKTIRLAGREDVFDVTVDDGHSLIFNGIATGNCSEILQINTPSTYHPDGSYDTVGKDISCNLASLNIAKAFDSPDFAKTVETAVRALTTVSDMSNIESVPSIAKGNNASHAIGLGQMNLHGFLAREHMHYDSEEARDFANMYFYSVTFNAISASNKISMERGESFEGFENSKYATGEYFDKYIDQQWTPKTERVKELLKKSTINIPTQADWIDLRERVRVGGMYNAYLQAVPPTGSISYINHSTSSIHPVVGAIETRKEGKLGRVYYPVPYLSDETLPYYKDAYRIGPKAIIDMYAVATQHVDQGLSLTLFYPADATTRDLNKSYIYAFSKGIKTMYYIRVKQKALAGTEMEGSVAEYCESCQL